MVACEVLSSTWRGSWQSVMFDVWLKTRKLQKDSPVPSQRVTSGPKAEEETHQRCHSFLLWNTWFDGVCDFTFGQLINNVAKEMKKKCIPKMRKK